MKIRNGFVSNSSSSSFVISMDKNENKICECCGRSENNVLEYIERASSCETEIDAIGKKDVINYIREYYYDQKDADIVIDKINKINDNENKIYYVSIDNNDEYIKDEILESKNINIISRED